MIKKAIFLTIFFILIINFVGATDIHLIRSQLNQICDVDWKCTPWGGCVEGESIRSCYDNNNCLLKYNIPLTKIKCSELAKPKYVSTSSIQLGLFGFFTGLLLLIFLIILNGLRR